MRFQFTLAAVMMGAIALASATPANAAFPDFYTDEGAFNAQGTIVHSTNFDGYGTNLTLLNPSENFGAVTLTGDPLIVIGTDSYLDPVRNVIANNVITEDLDGTIGPTGFNMLSFKLGILHGFGEQVFVELFTNLDSYAYGLYPGDAPDDLSFYGFIVVRSVSQPISLRVKAP